jgi:SEC-C motif
MLKIGRNSPCPCGSGLKYKRCCEEKDLTAAADEALGSETPEQFAEIHLLELVYQSVLAGVWLAFHGESSGMPGPDEMENFYRKIYGHDLDPSLIEEIVLPLSPRAMAQLKAVAPLPNKDVLEIASEEIPPAESGPESPNLST